jgi:AAA domain-containing protein
VLSDAATGSEMLEYELDTAADELRKRGRPMILPIRVGSDQPLEGAMGALINGLQYAVWQGPQDDEPLVSQIIAALADSSPPKKEPIEPAGGAVPPSSRFYTLRESDAEFDEAMRANESMILVKGPRQIGKTSLIGRGAVLAEELGWRQVSTDFQMLSVSQLFYEDQFTRLLAAMLARQTGFKYDFANEWLDVFGPTINLDNFLRALLEDSDKPLVWFMDEADRLFAVPFSDSFFGLVRSWHNARARDPRGPWGRLTIVIGYATEARLFIRDLNQSPFNVGRQIALKSFTVDQIADLNERYGRPIIRHSDLEALHFLLGGQPFLTRRALELVATGKITYSHLMDTADRDDGPFADHLKRMLVAVSHAPAVLGAVRSSLAMLPPSDADGVERLIAAGILKETPIGDIDLTCDLYTRYLARHIG